MSGPWGTPELGVRVSDPGVCLCALGALTGCGSVIWKSRVLALPWL